MGRVGAPSRYVGVVGPGEAGEAERQIAYDVGRMLAGVPVVVVTGGLGGVMEAASRRRRNSPTASSHQKTSRPRCCRGTRVWVPTDRTTCRPLAAISSASWTPVAEPPTTSTPPEGRSSGRR